MARDFYAILGVPKGASADDIKKAFRKAAQKHHPDVSKAPDAAAKFKEINDAYQVLSDAGQRARYDQFGEAGVGGLRHIGVMLLGRLAECLLDVVGTCPLRYAKDRVEVSCHLALLQQEDAESAYRMAIANEANR